MNPPERLPRQLFLQMHEDLERPHAHAGERVGFIFARAARVRGGVLLLGFDYTPVADEDYIEDPHVGAKINGHAIRVAMQRALSRGDGVIHVHVHDHSGVPGLSSVDMRGLVALMPSFCAVATHSPHAGLVISRDRAGGRVWLHGERESMPAKVSLVGHHVAIAGGQHG